MTADLATAPRPAALAQRDLADLVPDAAALKRAEESGWLTDVSRGDPQAMRKLWLRYRRPCLQVARRTLGGDAHTEDVVQTVFLDVWRHAGRYDATRASAGSWILTIAHHKAVDRVRHEQRRAALAAELPYLAPVAVAAADDVAVALVRRLTVRRALAGLCPAQRQVLQLAYFEELTYAEIAARLRVPLGTVKSRGRIGLQTLRSRLAELGEVDDAS